MRRASDADLAQYPYLYSGGERVLPEDGGVIPSLVAGCTFVPTSADVTPVPAMELARIFDETGFPPAVVTVVPGYGKGGADKHLANPPNVDKIAFVGECNSARTKPETGAATLKQFSFGLSRKSPHIINADAVLDQAPNVVTGSLITALWSRETGWAQRVAARIRAGSVWVNTYRSIRWTIPYGGLKVSG